MEDDPQSRALGCAQVQALLSGLLDVRRGETPTPEITPLGVPATRQAVEQHLEACPACQRELAALEDLDRAYAEFSVGEEPAEAFALYGAMVREKLRPGAALHPIRLHPVVKTENPWRLWAAMIVPSAAAAMLTVTVLLMFLPRTPATTAANRAEPTAAVPAPAPSPRQDVTVNLPMPQEVPHLEQRSGPTSFAIWGPNGPQAMRADLSQATGDEVLRQLEALAGEQGGLMLGEGPSAPQNQRALLGLGLQAQKKGAVPEAPEGLAVYQVQEGGPAERLGLQRGDYILKLCDMSFTASSPTEILKFLKAIEDLGKGKLVQIDYARWVGENWVLKRGSVVLGEYDQ